MAEIRIDATESEAVGYLLVVAGSAQGSSEDGDMTRVHNGWTFLSGIIGGLGADIVTVDAPVTFFSIEGPAAVQMDGSPVTTEQVIQLTGGNDVVLHPPGAADEEPPQAPDVSLNLPAPFNTRLGAASVASLGVGVVSLVEWAGPD